MNKYHILYLFILFNIKTLTSQVLGIDTLVVFHKKYELRRTNISLVGSEKSLLSTTPCNYYLHGRKSYKYFTQADTSCTGESSYDHVGNCQTEFLCVGKRTKVKYLYSFIDSVYIDYSKINYKAIKLKYKSKTYYFDIIEYILQYDTCRITFSLDKNAKDNYDLIQKSIEKYGKPKMIILNQLFYIDPKTGIAYQVPVQILFKEQR